MRKRTSMWSERKYGSRSYGGAGGIAHCSCWNLFENIGHSITSLVSAFFNLFSLEIGWYDPPNTWYWITNTATLMFTSGTRTQSILECTPYSPSNFIHLKHLKTILIQIQTDPCRKQNGVTSTGPHYLSYDINCYLFYKWTLAKQ